MAKPWDFAGQPGSGKCAACGAKCSRAYLMCPPCWSAVAPELKSLVRSTYAKYDAGTESLGELRSAQMAAVESAREAVTT